MARREIYVSLPLLQPLRDEMAHACAGRLVDVRKPPQSTQRRADIAPAPTEPSRGHVRVQSQLTRARWLPCEEWRPSKVSLVIMALRRPPRGEFANRDCAQAHARLCSQDVNCRLDSVES